MRRGLRTRTHRLASARLEFSDERRLRQTLQSVAIAVAIVAAIAAGAWFYGFGGTPGARLHSLERENAELKAELARARTELEFERSTRAALTAQVADLSQRAGELRSQVDFFNAQNARAGRAR